MLPNGHLVAVDKNHCILELDRDSKVVWQYDTIAHHDFARRPGGNSYVVTGRNRVAAAILPGRELFCDRVLEVTPTNDVVWAWNAEEHTSELGLREPYPAEYPFGDWPHINTCEILPESPTSRRDSRFRPGNLLMRGWIIHTVFVVDRDSGAVVWRWGADSRSRV